MPDAPPPLPKSQPFFKRRYSTMLKLFGVGALILVMLIPLFMIRASERSPGPAERSGRRHHFFLGQGQNIIGPLLVVPTCTMARLCVP